MTLLTHVAGAETAGALRTRLALYHDWTRLVSAADQLGVPVAEPYPPTPATPAAETKAMIARLAQKLEDLRQ